MKKILLMLALSGAIVTMPAQTTKESDKMNKEKGETTENMTPAQKNKNKQSDRTIINPGDQTDEERSRVGEDRTGMTAPTYTKTPVPQDKTDVSVPEKVRNRFASEYPKVRAMWNRERDYYTASYKKKYKEGDAKQDVETVVVFDKDAKIIRTESEIKYKKYPVAIVTYYETRYPSGVSYRVWEVENKQDGSKKYYAVQSGKTTWFDREGKEMMDHDDWHHGMDKPGSEKPIYK